MRTYLIDGNNLIGKIIYLNKIQLKDKQSAREQLVFLIENYFYNKKEKVYLHFDGYENEPLKLSKGKIIYSEKTSADNKIKDQIESAKNRKNLIVVSSDHEIQNFAKVCSCQIISSEDFGKKLTLRDEKDEEEIRIRSINNVEEFKKLFDTKR
jgi:predicted RNA-binding protein with PIN domain